LTLASAQITIKKLRRQKRQNNHETPAAAITF